MNVSSMYKRFCSMLVLSFAVLSVMAKDNIKLPYFFSNDMVLQRQKPIKLWGTPTAETAFDIEFAGKKEKVKTSKDGKWEVVFPAMEVGGPYGLKVISDSSFTINNILIGDVWVCSGQSNMELTLKRTINAPYELSKANYDGIRFFTVPKNASSFPVDTIKAAKWKICNSNDAWAFSAVAYFFARELYKTYKIPIGIIHTSWGGTPAESWTSPEALATYPDFAKKIDSLTKVFQAGNTTDVLQKEAYNNTVPYQKKIRETDKGYIEKWYRPDYNASSWRTFVVPGTLEQQDLQEYKGSIWLRKEMVIPSSMKLQDMILCLDKLNENDVTWINGTQIGGTTGAGGKRFYRVAKEFIVPGKNIITIRLETFGKPAGFEAKDASLIRLEQLVLSENPITIPLAGEWQYTMGMPYGQYLPMPKAGINVSNLPSVLYNGMINPFKNLAVKGFLWYQGENNAGRAYQYRTLFPLMIKDWRKQFNQGELPFIFTQLAGYGAITNNPVDHIWAELREAQSQTLSLPNTGMAVTIDVGDPFDIHPINKQVVGKRLADEAKRMVYGNTGLQTSPLYQSIRISGDSIRIKLSNIGKRLLSKDGVPAGFAIAGADKKFEWAKAKIDGDEIVVWLRNVKPVAVRYAWTGSPVESNGANVFNKDGYPLSPFRTDSWKGITEDKK